MASPFDRLRRQLVAAAVAERPAVPDAGRLLWRAFLALHNARTVTMAGAQAITFGDIEAWARVTRTPLQPRHVEILRAMDDAWLGKARSTSAGNKPAQPSQEVSPALFDAMFGA